MPLPTRHTDEGGLELDRIELACFNSDIFFCGGTVLTSATSDAGTTTLSATPSVAAHDVRRLRIVAPRQTAEHRGL
jgi:hypothetical protein